ncbi:MAG: Hsp20/alpha crystallin family protein [Qingshengfaniella sp.]
MPDATPDLPRRPDPLADDGWGRIDALRHEIDRLFDAGPPPLGRAATGFAWESPRSGTAGCSPLAPAMDLTEGQNAYRLSVELPGMTPEDIELRLKDDRLIVIGDKIDDDPEARDYFLCERRFGHFHRSVRLPAGIDRDAVSADFAQGLLTVILPKIPRQGREPRIIAIRTGQISTPDPQP